MEHSLCDRHYSRIGVLKIKYIKPGPHFPWVYHITREKLGSGQNSGRCIRIHCSWVRTQQYRLSFSDLKIQNLKYYQTELFECWQNAISREIYTMESCFMSKIIKTLYKIIFRLCVQGVYILGFDFFVPFLTCLIMFMKIFPNPNLKYSWFHYLDEGYSTCIALLWYSNHLLNAAVIQRLHQWLKSLITQEGSP
jgi:hypothetical protein